MKNIGKNADRAFLLFAKIPGDFESSRELGKFEYEVIPVLNWHNKSPQYKMSDARKIHEMIKNGTDFISPWAQEFCSLADFDTSIKNANKRHEEKMLKLPNSDIKFEAAISIMHNNAKSIKDLVRSKIRVTPKVDEKIRICHGAGFEYKKVNPRSKRKNKLVKGNIPGQLIGYAEGQRMHQWELSEDGGRTKEKLDPSTGGEIVINNLVSKKEYWVRNRLVLSKGRYGKWSDWTSEYAP